MELAIDTSTNFAGIALSSEGKTVAELTWYTEQNHTVELVPAITRLLEHTRTGRDALTALFVANGPGSFNGLRVGISTVKGLALALNIPVVAIGTLEIEAYPFSFTGLPVCAIHNAGRGEIAVAVYRWDDSWKCMDGVHISNVDVLCSNIKQKTIFCGEIPQPVEQRIGECLGDLAVVPAPVFRMRHTSCLAELGWLQLCQGNFSELAGLQPLYLRQPPITQPKRRYNIVRSE
jgi:tRNA threonylcarbamoyl adenosine modification protein YeaZ